MDFPAANISVTPVRCCRVPAAALGLAGQTVQVSRGKRQTTLPNAWWCAGIRRSARQQERDEAWALYSQSYRGTPKNEGFPTPSAPAASSDRVVGPQDHHIDWAPLGWLVFVESPVEESMRRSILRSNAPGLVLLGPVALAFAAGMFLARRMVGADPKRCPPVRRTSAAATSAGALPSRLETRSRRWPLSSTTWPAGLQEYANLEKKVELRKRTFRIAAANSDGDVGRAARSSSSSPSELDPISTDHLGERCTSLRS